MLLKPFYVGEALTLKKKSLIISMNLNILLMLFGLTLFFMATQMPFFAERPTLYTVLGLFLAGTSIYDFIKNIKKWRNLSTDT